MCTYDMDYDILCTEGEAMKTKTDKKLRESLISQAKDL
jgi:hypothetical protein